MKGLVKKIHLYIEHWNDRSTYPSFPVIKTFLPIRDIRRIEDVIRGNQNIINARHPVLFGWSWLGHLEMHISDDDEVPFSISITIYWLLPGNKPGMCGIITCCCSSSLLKLKDKEIKFWIAEQRVFNDIKD